MKRIFLFLSLVAMSFVMQAQIVYERPDYVHQNDEYAVAVYSNTTETGMLTNLFGPVENLVFEDFTFEQCILDTIRFYPPSFFDTEDFNSLEVYPTANCAFVNEMGYVIYLKIGWTQVQVIGMQGELPMLGAPASMISNEPLVTLSLPFSAESQLNNTGSVYQNFPIDAFADIIPADYWSIVSSLYDSVKFSVTTTQISDFDVDGYLTISDTNSFTGSRYIIREYREENILTNVFIRSIFSGTWGALADDPLLGSQLPIELPILDTTFSINYWAKYCGIPFVSMKTSRDYDTAYTVSLYNNEFLSIKPNQTENWSVYPNPSSDKVCFKTSLATSGVIKIFDIQGKIIINEEINSDIYIFDALNSPEGLYLYEIISNSGLEKQTGRFQIVR